MRVIYAVLILAGMVLIIGGMFFITYRKGVWESFYEEFRNTVDEAHLIKTDLNDMLNQSIGISQAIVDGIDTRMDDLHQLQESVKNTQLMLLQQNVRNNQLRMLQQVSEKRLALTEPGDLMALPEKCEEYFESECLEEQPAKGNKIRVYELAKELNMNSRELVVTLQELGFPVSNQLNTLDYELTLSIRQKLTLVEMDNPATVHQSDRVWSIKSYESNANEPMDIQSLREAHPYLAVRTLQEAGYSVCDMAQLLNRGQGEINLIINLISKKRQYA